jgi:chemotaxis protein MotC
MTQPVAAISVRKRPLPRHVRAGAHGIGIAALAFGLLAACAPFAAAVETRPPYEIVRSMEALQDQIALGNNAALNALPSLSAQLGDKLVAVDPEVWREPRNVRAAVIYVLSGGQARVVRKILSNFGGSAEDRRLLEGTLAYVENQEGKAKQILGDIDPRSLEPLVGAHLAVAEAALFVHDDPHKAIEFLDLARILAPGTLLEEAALRREVFLAQQINDFDKFASAAGQYLRRFSNSSYAENFFNRFSSSLIDTAVAGRLDQIAKLERILDEMNPTGRMRLYLAIAQSGLVNGKLDTAQYAAAKCMSYAQPGTSEAARAALYSAAVAVLMHPEQPDQAALEGVDLAKLTPGDKRLAQAVLAIAKEIHHWPDNRKAARDKESATVTPPAGSEPTIASADTAIDLAEKALAAAKDPKGKHP